MSYNVKTIGIIGLVTFLSGGLGYAFAQAPELSLPPLPGIPSAPSAPSAPQLGGLPTPDKSSSTTTPTTASGVTVASAKEVPAATDGPMAPNEAVDKISNAKTADTTPSITPPPMNTKDLPSLGTTTPSLGALPAPTVAPAATPFPTATATTSTDDQAAAAEIKKEPEKTWLTHLKPAIVPPKLGYNYRREILPNEIYRTHYDNTNRHLPTALTRDDYTRLFLMSVAKNDINATRALLNEGVQVNTTNAKGETALALAQRYGAGDTARLLMARGAR